MTTPASTPRRRSVITVAAIGALVLAGWLVRRAATAPDTGDQNPVTEAQVVSDSGVATVTLDSADLVRGGIIAQRPVTIAYRATVMAYGRVADVGSLATERADVAAARAAVARTAADAEAAQQELVRARALNADNQNVSTKVVEAARAAARGAAADADAAAAAERAVEQSAVQAWGPVIGRWIAAGTPQLDAVLARRRVLLVIALPAGTVLTAPPAQFVVEGVAGRAQARFVSAAYRTDPRTQGQTFYYDAPAAPDLLAGMTLTAALPIAPVRPVLEIPRSAVVWAEGGAWIYVQTGPRTFARESMSTDNPTATGYAVSGLAPGIRVVTQGAQLLLSEEYRSHARPAAAGDGDG